MEGEHQNGSLKPAQPKKFDVYISASWKERDRVRALACKIREEQGLSVFDFTDKACRPQGMEEIAPERFPEAFSPAKEVYQDYIQKVPEWRAAVNFNRFVLDRCRAVILLLPCGSDAHADWAYAVGRGARTAVVGQPREGERTPSHLWSNAFCRADEGALRWLSDEKKQGTFEPWWPAKAAMETAWAEEEEMFAALCIAGIRLSHRSKEERDQLRGVVEQLGADRVRRALQSLEWLKPEPEKKLIFPGA